MKHNNEFVKAFFERYSYPENAVEVFTQVLERLDSEPEFADSFDEAVNGYMFPQAGDLKQALEKVSALAEEKGINKYTLHFIFLLACAEILKSRWHLSGFPEEIYWDTMADMRYKFKECVDCEEIPGIFVADWYYGFFDMTRIALGRFQYEMRQFSPNDELVTKCGKEIKEGDYYINFHIPSSGVPITDEIRLESYKKAYGAFGKYFPDGKAVFGCGSWLLFPRHREFLPKNSNILKFMDDFEIICHSEKEGFSNGWRVFGKYSDLPYDKLPRDTSLRRAYADWLIAGNKTGDAFGIFVFDGEKILR